MRTYNEYIEWTGTSLDYKFRPIEWRIRAAHLALRDGRVCVLTGCGSGRDVDE